MSLSAGKWEVFHNYLEVPQKISEFLYRSTHGALFQSPEWAKFFSVRPGKSLVLSASQNGNPVFGALVKKSPIPGTRYFLGQVRRGPVFESIDHAIHLWGKFEKLLCRNGLIALTVSPYWERNECLKLEAYLHERGYEPSKELADHSESLVIDLLKSEEDIFKEFTKTRRNTLRKCRKQGIKAKHVGDSREMHLFWEMYHAMCKKKGIRGISRDAYQRIRSFASANPHYCACIVSWLDGELIGGDIVLRHGNRVVFTYGAGTPLPIKGASKTDTNLWYSFLWAKKTGASIMDLGGITPGAEKGSPAWGINQYKRGFAKTEIALFRPQQKIFKPMLFKIHRSLRKTKRSLIRK